MKRKEALNAGGAPLGDQLKGWSSGKSEEELKEKGGILLKSSEAQSKGLVSSGDFMGVEGSPVPTQMQPDNVDLRLGEAYGESFEANEPLSENFTDLWNTREVSNLKDPKAMNSFWQSQYPDGEIKLYDFPEGKTIVGTKDGSRWRRLNFFESTGMSLATDPAMWLSAAASVLPATQLARAAYATFGASIGSYFNNKWSSKLDPTIDVWKRVAQDTAFTSFGEFILGGGIIKLSRDSLLSKPSPGAIAAVEASRDLGVMPLTRGLIQDNPVAKRINEQAILLSEKRELEAKKRLISLDVEGLSKWLGDKDVSQLTPENLNALITRAGTEIDNILKSVIVDGSSFYKGMPALQSALDVYGTAARQANDRMYYRAFRIASDEGIEFDIHQVKSMAKTFLDGTPVKGVEPGTSVIYDLPSEELAGQLEKLQGISDIITDISRDGRHWENLKQLNAVRKSLSHLAYYGASPHDRKMATMVLKQLDDSIETPVYGMTTEYKAAYEAAKKGHEVHNAFMELKSIGSSKEATIDQYLEKMRHLTTPGRGQLLQLTKTLTKNTKGEWDAFRNAFMSDLVSDPASVTKKLDAFYDVGDEVGIRALLTKQEEKVIREFAENKLMLENSRLFKITESKDVSNYIKAQHLIDTNNLKELEDLVKIGGEDLRESMQAGVLHKLLQDSRLPLDPLTNVELINPAALLKNIEKLKNSGKWSAIFPDKADWDKLRAVESYSVRLTAAVSKDMADSLQAGAAAARGTKYAKHVIDDGVQKATFSFLGPLFSASIMIKSFGFSQPVKSIEPNTALRAMQELTKKTPYIFSKIYLQDRDYPEPVYGHKEGYSPEY